MYDETFMRRALALSETSLTKPGTRPYGAVVARGGEIVGEGLNQATGTFDPTSHGETEAIRDACRRLQSLDLSDCDLYASCEPCPLCVAAMTMTGIRRLYFGAGAAEAREAMADAETGGLRSVAIAELRHEAGSAPAHRHMPSDRKLEAEALEILRSWAAAHPRAG